MLRFDEKQLSRSKRENIQPQEVEAIGIDDEDDMEADGFLGEDEDAGEDEDSDDSSAVVDLETGSEVRNKRDWKDWRRMRKVYERSKQYIFVAATLPLNGKRTAGGLLKRMFPDANWVSGNHLHCQNPRFFLFNHIILHNSCLFLGYMM